MLVLLALVLALAVVAPLLLPGTVLVQDMVFVPRQPWRTEWLGLSTSLPRAVPGDAVVALLTAVLPGSVLQKAVLLLCVALAALGAGRLVPAQGFLGRAAAAVAYSWNPYVAERLLLGQWTLLVAHAALPWVVIGALALRAGRSGGLSRTLLAVGVASVSATGGVLALVGALVSAGRGRRTLPLLVGGVLLQLPWAVPGLLHPGGTGSDPAGVAAFAARAENWSGTLGALLTQGGIWNALAVPSSRMLWTTPLLSLALLLVAALGLPGLVRAWGRATVIRLSVLAGASVCVAALGALPGTAELLRLAVEHLPGAGLLRDGQKWLPPWSLLVAVAAGLGVERVGAVRTRLPLAVLALLLPVASLPDLAWGGAGRLAPVEWPDDWSRVRAALDADAGAGSVVSLPFTAYRAYAWNDGRPSLDPAPRWFDREVVVEDRLAVGDVLLEGEDARAARVRSALQAGRPLGDEGVGWVLVQRRTPGVVPESALEGAQLVVDGDDLELWRLPDVEPDETLGHLPPAAPVLAGQLLALGVLLAAVVGVARSVLRRRGWYPSH